VVKNSALGINSVDWAKQLLGEGLLGHISYPFILGEDVAGTVVEVGEGADSVVSKIYKNYLPEALANAAICASSRGDRSG
jgi:NADPH:quinone reductase-like Zn-dependent oxidoreductase